MATVTVVLPLPSCDTVVFKLSEDTAPLALPPAITNSLPSLWVCTPPPSAFTLMPPVRKCAMASFTVACPVPPILAALKVPLLAKENPLPPAAAPNTFFALLAKFASTALVAYNCEPLMASVLAAEIAPAATFTIWRSPAALPTETTPVGVPWKVPNFMLLMVTSFTS